MPEEFYNDIKKLQDLKKSDPNGVNQEQYLDTLYSLIQESDVVRYYSEDDQEVFVPFWKTMNSPDSVKENILWHAKDDKGISILCKSGLEGDPYIISLDKNGKLTEVSDGPVPAEDAMKRFNGPAEPKKPSAGDYLHHWFKNTFFAGLFWKKDRPDAVDQYRQFAKDKEDFKSKSGYTPNFEIGKKKEADEAAAREQEKQLNANDVEPDLSVKEPLSTEVSADVRTKALAAKPLYRMLTPSQLGYQATDAEENVMLANMPGLDQFAKPEKLSDRRLADDWQAYSEFTTKVIDASKNDIKITGLIDTMSQSGTLKTLYGYYKTNYFNHRTIDLESALSEAVSKADNKSDYSLDITSHILKGSTYNPQVDQKPKPIQQGGMGKF